LALWLALGLLLFVFLNFSIALQIGVSVIFAAGYVVWGVMHHQLADDLSFEVVLEYLTVAVLMVVLVGGVLLQR
jgi:hypothetical protein